MDVGTELVILDSQRKDRRQGLLSEVLRDYSLRKKGLGGSLFFREPQDLVDHLRFVFPRRRLVVILGADEAFFDGPWWDDGLTGLLGEVQLILVLMDASPGLVKKAHSLKPRYLTFTGAPEADLLEVVDKILDCRFSAGGQGSREEGENP